MQKSLSLEKGLCSPLETKEYCGVEIPWRLKDDAQFARGGLFDLSFWGTIQMTGPDVVDYLQRMSTVDFKKLGVNAVAAGAFLTGRGGVVSLGYFERLEKGVCVHAPHHLINTTLEHIEKFHFAENFTAAVLLESSFLGVYAPKTPVLGLSAPRLTSEWRTQPVTLVTLGEKTNRGWWDLARENLFWVRIEPQDFSAATRQLVGAGFPLLGGEVFEFLRIEAGVPQVPGELGETDIVLEGGCDWVVARNKGCYPGQEVVERIFTYGSVNRKLMKMKLSAMPAAVPQTVGPVTIVAAARRPDDQNEILGLAFVPKAQWENRQPWRQEGLEVTPR
ncbi:MAG: hypothetical protein HYZ71_13370 [Deltaproteobacteria bacterium]|nr:hypothetical protein [Deltaproteobacteria bacterium]